MTTDTSTTDSPDESPTTAEIDYEAVVFDKDGVLVEPTETRRIREALEETFAEFAVPSPPASVLEGLLAQETMREALHCQFGIDPGAFWRRREHNAATAQMEAARAGEKTPYDDLRDLERLPVPLGLVSNNQRMTVEFMLDHFDFGDLFETAYGREPTLTGARRKKPEPYYLEQALADLEVADALYVGDSNTDLEAAHRAGLDAAFVRRPHREDYDLEHDPTVEVASLSELVSWLTA
jgi:HAD superfamily hydrolase (TIGR01549 family)